MEESTYIFIQDTPKSAISKQDSPDQLSSIALYLDLLKDSLPFYASTLVGSGTSGYHLVKFNLFPWEMTHCNLLNRFTILFFFKDMQFPWIKAEITSTKKSETLRWLLSITLESSVRKKRRTNV